MPVYALADCNSFYASCEKAFNPQLKNRPVAVLSNNDGCVVSRSAEAKKLGIPMGAPAFKHEALFKANNVAVFSSNYALYGDMSARVMRTMADMVPACEVYSIDEAFLRLDGLRGDMTAICGKIRERVLRWTGIPISIGIGETKTLAKAANKLAKQSNGIFDLRGPDADEWLASLDVGDVWGVGPQYAKLLQSRRIHTSLDLKRADRVWIRKHMTVQGLQTVLELNGQPCIPMEQAPPPKKAICCSRSFGAYVRSLEGLREAVASYATRAAEKLRGQDSVCSIVQVFIRTNPFKPEHRQHAELAQATLSVASDYTPDLLRAALGILERLFRTGHAYQKAGVLLAGIEPKGSRQLSLIAPQPADESKRGKAMAVLDAANRRYGRGALAYAAGGIEPEWGMKREKLSPAYTTRWDQLLEVRGGR
ncbi:Y-family DNA polymerase [Desulfocurvibacter africanus]|uniref:DNA-directed DNA polymerase n=1 Tax=Desulfocurvibacter africanus subsp. africanus str. Walvis Bay TaxID=690850 RepID=F3YZR5_DESAF|nr:Y-family DNA polymerase [Desulfocurvibacter africanus]EGJ50870.1 DNA-directed DNA polymerase [Desulfocurvibacter africanus subsp. africanus str. Walvis Bay]